MPREGWKRGLLAVLFAAGEIALAHVLPLRQEIEEDLASFTTATTAAGNQIITQLRTLARHGDLGIALTVSAFASQYLDGQKVDASTLRGWH